MTYVIGDIHGEITKLKNLIHNILNVDLHPKYIFLGDYINKGENSKEVLDYLIQLKNAIFLIGNHEYYYLKYIKDGSQKEKLIKYGIETTFKDFNMNFDTIYEKLYIPYQEFFDSLLPFYETKEYFISHGGININFLEEDFNSLTPEKFFLFDRYEFITLNKKIKGKVSIFGHTGFNYPFYDGNKIGIDTSAVYLKESDLTSFCLEKQQFINDKNKKYFLSDMRLDRCPWIRKVTPYRLENR